MQDLILGLSLMLLGAIDADRADVPPPPKAEGWPMEVKIDRARRKAARSAARQRNMAALGTLGAQLDAQASVLAAQSAGQTAAYNYRMANYLALQNSRFPATSTSRYYSGWAGTSWLDCTPSRASLCSPGATIAPIRSSFSSPGFADSPGRWEQD